MGRPPCCDKVGIKKGPWTPEEDIILASYIAEHGPGNWRSVPTNTGLLRCSKSCRLRWTNYLRPGIKRGNFTDHEERIIVQLQGVLGNKWAAIASYLPQRTDNDIKNYWNTHLKKKMKKQFQSFLHPQMSSLDSTTFQLFKKSYSAGKRRSFLTDMTHHQISTISKLNLPTSSTTTSSTTTSTSTYASSTENISRLLEGWMKSSPKLTSTTATATTTLKKAQVDNKVKVLNQTAANINPKVEEEKCDELLSHEEFESLLSFDENISNLAWENKSSSTSDSTIQDDQTNENTHDEDEKLDSMSLEGDHREGLMDEDQPPFSLLEKWLLDESTGQVLEEMELSSIF